MSRLEPALARRIDRLARRAHAFHRFAHHPLCGPYGGEIVRVGRRARVCRGCALAGVGAAVGLALGAVMPPMEGRLLVALAFTSLGALGWATLPVRSGGKVLSRLLPLTLAGLTLAGGGRAANLWGAMAVLSTCLALALATLRYRRRGANRLACDSCPVRAQRPACPGALRILRREQAFQRLASRWMDAGLG